MDLQAWFAQRIPADWFVEAASVTADAEEILVVGTLADANPATEDAREERVDAFRDETRAKRIEIADAAERKFGRKVAWGVRIGDDEYTFTSLSVPVMTRLRMSERAVLDTLVSAGVARSRSDALAWCVRQVGTHQSDWLDELRKAFEAVKKVREQGPTA